MELKYITLNTVIVIHLLVEIQLALYSDMKVPHDIPRVLLQSKSLEFIEIISPLISELNLRFLNPKSG